VILHSRRKAVLVNPSEASIALFRISDEAEKRAEKVKLVYKGTLLNWPKDSFAIEGELIVLQAGGTDLAVFDVADASLDS
jgi:hypothetical protein